MDVITLKEFKKFFASNNAYVKWFDSFTGGKYTVGAMNQSTFNEEAQAVFFAFFNLVDPKNTYSSRVDFIQKWYKAVPGRAQKLLALYGSNSIIYSIKEESMQEATWRRLVKCMGDATLEEHGLAHLISVTESPKPVKLLKAEFIEYFTAGPGKSKKDDFNKFIGIDGYTQGVINGNRNYSQAVHDDFTRYASSSKELSFADQLNDYFRKNKDVKIELCSVLYKQFTNVTTTAAFIELLRNPSAMSKSKRSQVTRVITECRKIYA